MSSNQPQWAEEVAAHESNTMSATAQGGQGMAENILQLSDEEWVAALEYLLNESPKHDIPKTQSSDKQTYYGVWETYADSCR